MVKAADTGQRGEETESPWPTRRPHHSRPRVTGRRGKEQNHTGTPSETGRPTQRRLFLCGFHRTGASGAGRVLQLPLPRAHALLPPSPGSCETTQRTQAITCRSLTHVLRLQGPDRRQGQRNANAQVCQGKQQNKQKDSNQTWKSRKKKKASRGLHKYLILQSKRKKQEFAKDWWNRRWKMN